MIMIMIIIIIIIIIIMIIIINISDIKIERRFDDSMSSLPSSKYMIGLIAGGVRTLIALHHGPKTEIVSFASRRGRVNIFCCSKNSANV